MSLQVVGGIYLERVEFPPDEVLSGSGGRAAFAIKELDPEVELTSFKGDDRARDIDYHVETVWQIPVTTKTVPETVTFSYYHGLSTPIIRPTRLPVSGAGTLEVEGGAILQFGMLEGDALVRGERVVFDPQNPESPELFDRFGSSARELVYLLNRSEAMRLTGEVRIEECAAALLAVDNVQAVIVKCGALGAHVVTRERSDVVRSYKTNRVWPIGSGDVFAAVFAHYWATERRTPLESAELASRGAALYCARRDLPLVRKEVECQEFAFPQVVPSSQPCDCSIYLAGPFFTMGQLWLVNESRHNFQSAGFDVFSPYHNVGVGEAAEVVPEDIVGLEAADVVFALCDGLDAGTIFEVGYAVRHGIPVVAFAEQVTGESMKMLKGTGCTVLSDFTSAVYHAQWAAMT